MWGHGYDWCDSSSAFDVMVVSVRSSLPRLPYPGMLGTDLLQTPRAWFWGTHKWAISVALLDSRVSRIAGNVLVFGPLLHRSIALWSLRQSFSDGCSVCSGLFWGKRWWSVGVMVADEKRPGLGYTSSLAVEDGFLITDQSFDFSVGQMSWGLLLSLPSIAS